MLDVRHCFKKNKQTAIIKNISRYASFGNKTDVPVFLRTVLST